MKIFLGITGASGQAYGGRLLKALVDTGNEVTVCFSGGAVDVIRAEEPGMPQVRPGQDAADRDEVVQAFLEKNGVSLRDLTIADPGDLGHAYSSGSSLGGAAVVCPCSMNTLASVATGITRNLIHRVADVMLKESRPLVLVPRETPLSEIHLDNMLRLRRAGAMIVPAMPALYHRPQKIDDLVDFMAGKVLDVLGISHESFSRWEG